MQLWSILCQSESTWGLRQQNQMQGWVKIWNSQTEWSSWLLKGLEQLHWQGEAKRMRSFDSIATFSRKRVKCRRNKRERVCYHCMLFNFSLLKMASSTWGRDCSTHLWTVVQCLRDALAIMFLGTFVRQNSAIKTKKPNHIKYKHCQIYQHILEKAVTVRHEKGSFGPQKKRTFELILPSLWNKTGGLCMTCPPMLCRPSQPHKKVTENKKLPTSIPFYYLFYLSSLGSNTYHELQWKNPWTKNKNEAERGKGVRVEKRGVLFL